MKKSITLGYLILIILLSNVNIVFGQSFVNFNNRWHVGSDFGTSVGVAAYFFKPTDSLVTEKGIYYQLYSTFDTTFTELYSTDTWYRQEGSKVYQRYPNGEDELFYDFDLLVGDTITYTYSGDIEFVVVAVDSIELINGTKRKRLTLSQPYLPSDYPRVNWIEGIGSESWTFHPYGVFFTAGFEFLECYYEKNTVLYKTSLFPTSSCNLERGTVNTNNLPTLQGIKIYPTIAYHEIQIEIQDNGEYLCQVFDMNGKEVHRQFITLGWTTFSLDDVAAGMYFVRVVDLENHSTFVGKVIKQ